MKKEVLEFLADENIPLEVVLKLKEEGIDIISLSKTNPGLKDEEILAKAVLENKVVITFDNDFGELIFRQKMKSQGIILLKIQPQTPEYIFSILKKALDLKINFINSFCVVEKHRIRVIQLKV